MEGWMRAVVQDPAHPVAGDICVSGIGMRQLATRRYKVDNDNLELKVLVLLRQQEVQLG